jgi:hypothetical protein
MSKEIKELENEIKVLEEQNERYWGLFSNTNSTLSVLIDKFCESNSRPKSLKEELLKELKEYLDIQDLQQVAKSLKFSTQYVQNVLNDKCNDNNVINALHTQALANKELLLTSYKQMIDTLKK